MNGDKRLFWALLGSTLVVIPWFMYDAVVLAKFSLILVFGSFLLARVAHFRLTRQVFITDPFVICLLIMILVQIGAAVFSTNPWLAFFGYQGRYTGPALFVGILGFVLYVYLSRANTGYTLLQSIEVTSALTSIYFLMQLNNLDIFQWQDYYDVPSSFLGNPNFVSSFVACGLVISSSKLVSKKLREGLGKLDKNNNKFILLTLLVTVLQVLTLILSESVQGFLVYFVGVSTVIVLFNRNVFQRKLISVVLAIAPLAAITFAFYYWQDKILQSTEISARLYFWVISGRILMSNWSIGLGNSSFLDMYFREYTNLEDAVKFGQPNTLQPDSAHNYLLDLGLSGGIVLVILFLIINLIAVKRFFRKNNFSPVPILVFSIFVSMLVPCLINPVPNHLVLWIFVLLAYLAKRQTEYEVKDTKALTFSNANKKLSEPESALIKFNIRTVGALCILFALIPALSDIRFKESLYSRDLEKIAASAMKWPTNPDRNYYAIQIMCANKNPALARSLTKFGLLSNPRDSNTWLILLGQNLSTDQKEKVKVALNKLDPSLMRHRPNLVEEESKNPSCISGEPDNSYFDWP